MSALGITRGYMDDYTPSVVCGQCGTRPAFYQQTQCYQCAPNPDIVQACYTCASCASTRRYLRETDDQFVLLQCGAQDQDAGPLSYPTRDVAELWGCKRCRITLCIQEMRPGIMRDLLHEKMRREHTSPCYGRIIPAAFLRQLPPEVFAFVSERIESGSTNAECSVCDQFACNILTR